jgi:hypothetical protein
MRKDYIAATESADHESVFANIAQRQIWAVQSAVPMFLYHGRSFLIWCLFLLVSVVESFRECFQG